MKPDNQKRKRQKTDKYGSTDEGNMDKQFEEIDQRKKDDDYVPGTSDESESDESGSDESGSGGSESGISAKSESLSNQCPKKNASPNESGSKFSRQLSRMEAKIDQMRSIVDKIHRAHISNVVSSSVLDKVAELPLTSREMLDKFDADLSDARYRQKIVSIVLDFNWNSNHNANILRFDYFFIVSLS